MINKKNIIKLIKIFFVVLMSHFLIMTFLKFKLWQDLGLHMFSSNLWALWKEFFLSIIYVLILIVNYKQYKFSLKKYFAGEFHIKITFLVIAFTIIWFIVSFLNKLPLSTIFLGVKYDLIMLLPIIFFPMLKIDKYDLQDFVDFLLILIKYVLFFSLLFWTVRMLDPIFLKNFGFGRYNAFIPGHKPPYFYGTVDTRLYSTIRESGIFAGPNVLAFFTVFVFPIVFVYYISTPKEQRKIWITTIFLIMFLLIVSLSRTALIGLFLEILLIMFYYTYINKSKLSKPIKKVFGYIWLGFLLVIIAGVINAFQVWIYESLLYRMIVRSASTWWHFQNMMNGFFMFLWNIWWLWFGTAWPAAVQAWTGIVPENRWLQIFLETWIFWWILYISLFFYILYTLYILSQKQKQEFFKNFYFFAMVALMSIMVAGLFLHMFDDSMISLFVTGFIWIILWIKNEDNNKKQIR